MNNPILLNTKNLSVGYFNDLLSQTLFDNLDLTLLQGQLICFMGPNGVGKSTLIRTLAGLQKPLKGEIILSSSTAGETAPTKISVVLTDKVSAVNMTVRELIAYGRYPYLGWNIKLSEEDHTIITQSVELTRIQHLLDKKLFELSDGQLQMAMLARALTQDTSIILLDEPTAHLDLNNRVEIMNLLRNLARCQGKAILVSTHELDLALQTADLIWLAGSEKKILTGIPEDLVLNGSFDEIFQFKGFDLKTGKVFHESYRKLLVHLAGEGYEYLWTKNALERTGYTVSDTANNPLSIHVTKNANQLQWAFQEKNYRSLNELLQHLENMTA